MSALDQALIDEILASSLDLLRFEAGVRQQVLAMLERLRRELRAQLAAEDITAMNKARLKELLREATMVVDRYYVQMQGTMEGAMTGAARAAVRQTATTLAEPMLLINVAVGLPTKTFMERLASNVLIMGAPSAEWWAKQSTDTAFKFGNAVRQGLLAGEANEQIVRRVIGEKVMTDARGNMWTASRSNIRALVHSSVQAASAAARRETYAKNRDVIKGIRQHSTFDSHTSEICIAYSGQEWDIDTLEPLPGSHLPYNGGVPRHWNCRSAEVPILKTFREMGLDMDEPTIGTRASSEGQIKADTTFEQWLGRRTEAQQDEQLGVGRAQMWRDGTITLEQLLDLSGSPMNLAQLTKKYGG